MWCVPALDEEFIERMEDILDLYERPYDPRMPVVCLDERPVQLHDDAREGMALRAGRPERYDYEYVRKGTANVFCGVQPLAGRHFAKATPDRSGAQFAQVLREIGRRYPRATTIHLVVDNLSTHTEKPLIRHLGPRRGARLWRRFTVHYTPKHGSWLNMAEMEISLLNRQCLSGRRLPTLRRLRSEVRAWERDVNANRTRISWRFTKRDARKRFDY